MISDATLAHLCMAIYEYHWWEGQPVVWDHVTHPAEDDGVMWALKRTEGFDVIVFRGTTSLHDWFYNFIAFSVPFEKGPLGPLHPGFKAGCEEAWLTIRPILKNPLIVTGHSLGGAHAAIVGAMAQLDERIPVVRRVTFGEPRPGFRKLAAITSKVPSTLYLNGWDIIPGLPVQLPPLQNYCHDRPMTRVNVAPHGHALLFGPFAWHHMSLYEEALKGTDDGKG